MSLWTTTYRRHVSRVLRVCYGTVKCGGRPRIGRMPADWNDERWTAVFFVESGAGLDWLAAHLGARANLVGAARRDFVSRVEGRRTLRPAVPMSSPVLTSTHSVASVPDAHDERAVRSCWRRSRSARAATARADARATAPGRTRPAPAARRDSATSSSTAIVRVLTSTACAMRATRAGKRLTRIRRHRERHRRAGVTPAMYASGTGTTSRSRSLLDRAAASASRCRRRWPGPTSAPGWTLRSVTTPSNGAVTFR